jgi:uncharacterized protein YyaL (SSP411 family)
MRAIFTALSVSLALFVVADALTVVNAAPAEAKRHREQVGSGYGQQSVQWYGNLNDALAQAKVQNKQVLVLIATDWCPHCRALEQGIIPQSSVQDYLNNNFIAVRVDGDKPYAASLKKQYGFNGVPTMMIFSPDGQLLNQMSGEPRSAEAFISSLSALARRTDIPADEPTY